MNLPGVPNIRNASDSFLSVTAAVPGELGSFENNGDTALASSAEDAGAGEETVAYSFDSLIAASKIELNFDGANGCKNADN